MSIDPKDQPALNSGRAFPWHELYTPDIDASLAFYKNALGLESSSIAMPGFGDYHMLKHGGNEVAGVVSTQTPGMEHTPPHWAVYLNVDDVDARVAKVEEFGGKTLAPAMDVPSVGRMALVADPNGAALWLFKPNPMG